jgi:hypothetical protein
VTGFEFLLAVWGAWNCVPCCVWRARGGVRAVMLAQCAVVAAVRDVVRARETWCVCMLRVRVRCSVCGLLARVVSGGMRHDADVSLCWVGLVVSCVCLCARVRGVIVSGSAALVGMCAAVRVGPANM